MLMSLSREPSDYNQEFYWGPEGVLTYNDAANGFGFKYLNAGAIPVGSWSMEVVSRTPGATSGYYVRYGLNSQIQVNNFTSKPSPVFRDNFSVGADWRDKTGYLNGDVAIVLLYNRSLLRSELEQMVGFYSPRFGWSR